MPHAHARMIQNLERSSDCTALVQNDHYAPTHPPYAGIVEPWTWIYFSSFLIIVSIGLLELLTAVFVDTLYEERRRERMLEDDQEKAAFKAIL